MTKKIYKNLFLGILFLGILLRIIWVVLVNTQPISDFLWYHELALSLISNNGYRIKGVLTAYEPIGYPAFLALIYYFFGANIVFPKIANIILSSIGMTFLYRISGKYISKKSGIICTLFIAILPVNIVYTSVLSTEILFTTLYIILTYFILKGSNKTALNILMGIILGILALIKPYMLIYPAVILAMQFFCNVKISKTLIANFCVITLSMIVIILPWTIRNYIVFDKFIPVSTNGGYNLYVNNNPYANGGWQDPFKFPNSPMLKYEFSDIGFWDEIKVDEEGKKLAVEWIVKNPDKFLKLGFIKLKRVFIIHDSGYWAIKKIQGDTEFPYKTQLSSLNKKIHNITLVFVIIYVLAIIIKILKKRPLLYIHKIILLNLLFYVSVTFAFEGQPRYLFPLWPFYAIIVSCLLTNTYSLIENTRCDYFEESNE